MRIGHLRHLITIRRQTDVPDGKGGFDRGWATLADNVPAAVTSLNGRESVVSSVLQSVSTFQITVRYRTDIRPSDQVKWEGRELNVSVAEDLLGTRKWTVINASSEAPQGA